ncbi:MAG: universal stress protein [Acidobacteria bacterium]|nr:universal stress protein [Acidobacteriota bacterium]
MKILLAVDGSTYSEAAVNELVVNPWPNGSVVKVISAVRLPFIPTEETRLLPDSDYSRMERTGLQYANASIASVLTHLRARKPDPFDVESEVTIGDAREVILDEASRWKADLIILGSRGLGGFKRFLLGSVALGVLMHAPCSVRIVRGSPAQGSGAAMRILLAVDGSFCGLAAAEEVAWRPWPEGSSVKIIHVAEQPLILPQVEQKLPEAFLSQLQKSASYAIDKAAAQFPTHANARLAVANEILHGNPKKAILDAAEKWGADLIVLGSHGMGAVERFLLGSVSRSVATHAKCSVEVIRRPRCESVGVE